ncbi:cob(I)yrinic acid a,c-diamide adenosyltransferase [Entomobacter blattae]|uniref:Corrinoid adenosyltransferase n=1 Tax=Entomobacter blattae TaxID=2762277 RepID=A0A7H1NQ32_9PROT|nr:cob(I)yrinic acid a,c-diamide adenosyltransferase [Entomobacter blattae]QNT77892.1 Cob(I)yrinic acid a,c-diamide adenosyltransferase [Entomobacter blattae]
MDNTHQKKMQKRKELYEKKVLARQEKRGLFMINTGKGKGKSSAAFGLALRMIGHGRKVGVVQFIKGAWQTGERKAFSHWGDLVEWHTLGEGFTWETQDKERDIVSCQNAWNTALRLLQDESLSLLILDELNIALRYHYLDVHAVVRAIMARPAGLSVVVTGRNAPVELVAEADTVTEMDNIRHHAQNGVMAQEGIEY